MSDIARKALPFLSHYAQKYVTERHSNTPILDDGGYEDQLFAVLDEICEACGEPKLDRAELIALAGESGRMMWQDAPGG